MGLCLVLTENRDSIQYFDTAIDAYLDQSEIRRAVRTCLWCVDAFRALPGRMRDAAKYLARAGSIPKDSSLRVALMQEQAAYAFLTMKPPMLRKYCFHLTIAGDAYRKSRNVSLVLMGSLSQSGES